MPLAPTLAKICNPSQLGCKFDRDRRVGIQTPDAGTAFDQERRPPLCDDFDVQMCRWAWTSGCLRMAHLESLSALGISRRPCQSEYKGEGLHADRGLFKAILGRE